MTVARRLLGEELHLLRREGVAGWTLLALVLLIVAAAINGRMLLAAEMRAGAQLTAESNETRAALAQQAARGVPSARAPGAVGYSVLGAAAVLPPAPLGAFAIGQADILPARYLVTARGAHNFLDLAAIDNPLRLALGNFDVAFVIVWLLPLVLVALTFNLVSGERERGVLALAAVSGSDLQRLFAGKCLARGLLLLATLWLALLLAAIVAQVPLNHGATLLAWLLWGLAASCYGAFWFALAIWVNTRALASDINASILIAAWLLFVVLLPALTNLAAVTAFAAPSRVHLTTELREATEAADKRAAGERDRYFFDHPDMRGQDMDMSAYYLSVARSEHEIAANMLPLLANFDAQAQRQQTLIRRLQYLSPGTLSYEILTALAGSDGLRHRQLREETLRFHARWRDFFDSRMRQGSLLTADDYRQLPSFGFNEPSLARVFDRLWLPLASLGLLALGLWWWALLRLRAISIV